jgi:hypothetical protein
MHSTPAPFSWDDHFPFRFEFDTIVIKLRSNRHPVELGDKTAARNLT